MDIRNMDLEERMKYLAMKERQKKILVPWYKKWWGISLIIIAALILISLSAAVFYVYDEMMRIVRTGSASSSSDSATTTLAIEGPGSNYSLGSKDAAVTIVEFSDFACPYCQEAYTVVRDAANKYPGQIRIIFRDLPLHDTSSELALAARCAGEQGKFWEMHDQLFANQTALSAEDNSSLPSMLTGLAVKVGVNKSQYDSCYQNKKYINNIAVDFQDAESLGVNGTPTWFMNGKKITGYIPEESFFDIINNLISIYQKKK